MDLRARRGGERLGDVSLTRLLTLAYFTLIASLAHWKLVFLGMILADYDAFVYFYANREYTAARLLEGTLPIWNPYIFAGIPHLANPQSAVFYPGTWIFLLLPTPYAYTANLVIHTAIAGYALSALSRELLPVSRIGGLVAGTCYMLSGVITGQGGHLNQLSGSALLPLVLLAAHRSIDRLSVRWSAITAAMLALQLVAGHPQVTYLTLVLMGFMLLWALAASEPRRWAPRVLLVSLAGALAIGLSAIQVLPTLEATRLGIRAGGMSLGEAAASSLPPELLPLALLPGYTENPASTEFLGFIGASGLTLAIIGAVTGTTGRQAWIVVAAAVSVLLSLGSYAQVFDALFGVVPGLDAFRVPARWLLPWTLCVSLLAGAGTAAPPSISLLRRVVALCLAAIPIVLAVWASRSPEVQARYGVPDVAISAWLTLLALTLVSWLAAMSRLRVFATTILAVLVAGELFAARYDLPFSHAVPSFAWKADSSTVAALRDEHPAFRVLSIAGDGYQPDRTASLREQFPNLGDYAFELLVTATKWADLQSPNLPTLYRLPSVDGYDGGVFPLSHYILAATLFHPLGDIRPDGVLISSLDVVPRRSALDLFAVNAVITSYEKDVEVNGIVFDRAVLATLSPSQSLSFADLPAWRPSRLALLLSTGETRSRLGDSLLEIRARDASGQQTVIPLVAGIDVPYVDDARTGQSPGTVLPPWRSSSGLPATSLVEVRLNPGPLQALEIQNVSSDTPVLIAGGTLVGSQPGEQASLLLDPSLTVRPAGDARVYVRSDPLPRAYLTHQAAAMSDEAANVAMFEPAWDPAALTILESGSSPVVEPSRGAERADLSMSLPEETLIQVDASSAALLVLSDSWYPGWMAEVDGQPVRIFRANVNFRAVQVPGGRHEVRFVYDPATLRMGAAVSVVSLCMVAGLVCIGQRLLRPLL